MAETVTANFGWTMPDPGGSANTWGNTLNATTQKIDAQTFANQQAITAAQAPIGSIIMFGGATAPANWVICDGSSFPTTGVGAALFAVIGYTYGGSGANFNLPNMTDVFPIGAETSGGTATDIGDAGGDFTYALDVAHLPPHAHPIADVAHNHSVNQWAHAHNIATNGHNHVLHDPSHTHTYATLGGGVNIQPGSGGNMSNTGNTGAAATGITIDAVGNLGGNTDTQTSGVSLNASGTNLSTTQAVGSGAPMTILPPYLVLNFIIRYQ